jgi:predicted anti-sigma-YlaC factor YlaD
MLSCKQATELMSREVDAPPTLAERWSLAFHLSLCSGCRNFRRQMAFLHQVCRHRPEVVSPSAERKD